MRSLHCLRQKHHKTNNREKFCKSDAKDVSMVMSLGNE